MAAIGTTTHGDKVHLGEEGGQLRCTATPSAPQMTRVIARVDLSGTDVYNVLVTHKVTPDRLCAHCFFRRAGVLSAYLGRLHAARLIINALKGTPGGARTPRQIAELVESSERETQNILNWLVRLGLITRDASGPRPRYGLVERPSRPGRRTERNS